MTFRHALAIGGSIVAVFSCSRAPATPSPAPGGGPATSVPAAPVATAPTGGATGQPGATPGRRQPPTRDSLAKARAFYVAQVLESIAGKENQPAEQVFQNVQVLKGITAAELV